MLAHDRKVIFSSESDEWSTPSNIFIALNQQYGFTLDPAASKENHKCPKFYDKNDDGLSKSWKDERVFLNPPYSETKKWIEKSLQEKDSAEVVVLLIAARTDTQAFHELLKHAKTIMFIKGRLKFNNSKNSAPFPSCVVVLEKNHTNDNGGMPAVWSISNKI